MTTFAEAMAKAVATLRAAGISSARLDARVLATYALELPKGQVVSPVLELSGEQVLAFEAVIHRRSGGEPVAYLTGHKEFFGLDFQVGPGVLIPRPETETLVEDALKDFPDEGESIRALDLGAGSGCLLLALLVSRPMASGTAIDRSAEALKWCKYNVLHHNLQTRCELLNGDWANGIEGQFQIVFSNPPYIPTEEIRSLPVDVRSFEPFGALDGGQDGLDTYRSIAPVLRETLVPAGRAYLEIGDGQHQMVAKIMEAAGLEVARLTLDLAGIPRCIVVSSPGKPS